MLSKVSLLTGQQSRMIIGMLARATRTSALVSAQVAESSQRDLINFPRPVRLEESGKVRMCFIPDEWFQAFYNKTGVTGPYVLGVGLATFLCSKEYYVFEHEYYTGLSLFVMCYMAVTKLGPMTAAQCDKEIQVIEDEWTAEQKTEIGNLNIIIKEEEHSQWQADGHLELIKAKRENVALQLEAEYRARLMKAYTDVKNRLDLQIAIYNVDKYFIQKNLIEWVVKNVLVSISSEKDKDHINTCIEHLGELIKNQKPV